MKLNRYIFRTVLSALSFSLSLSFTLSLTSCYKDHSSEIEEMVSDIIIADFDELYTVESFAGNKLTLTPDITSGYDENKMTFEWYLIDRQAESTFSKDEVYEREHIGSGKTLDYEVNLSPGDYYVVLEAIAPNGYMVSKLINLRAVTSFSQGFYILKQTADGNTELDLYNPETGMFKENIFTSLDGSPWAGEPGYLSVSLEHSYIDVQTNKTAIANMLTVTNKNGDLRTMRTSDLKEVLNRSNILFENFDEGEVPYRIVSCMWLNVLVTNNGLRSQYQGTISPGATGRYGITNGVKASPWMAYNPDDNGLYFWDNSTSSICHCDYNGTIVIAEDDTYKINRLRNTECVHVGYNYTKQSVLFVTRNRLNGVKQLFRLSAGFASGYKVEGITNLNTSKINAAIDFTTCTHSAAYLYGLLDDGTIWAYDIESGTERQIKPVGIPDDEKITYISDKSINSSEIHFIVGTTKGDTYTLRYYHLLGGMIDGQPVYTVSGKGDIKSIQYVSGDLSSYRVSPMQN